MPIYYIINNLIEFHPEKKQLIKLGSTENIYTLNTPASKCLELLLLKHPSDVEQSEFYEYVWGMENSKSVTQNTLYQNISIVRKGLRFFDEESMQSAILTIPRKGFKLADTIYVDIFDENTETEVAYDNNEAVISVKKDVKHNTFVYYSILFYLAALIILSLIAGFNYGFDVRGGGYFEKYKRITFNEGCNYYSNNGNKELISQSKFFNEITEKKCLERPWVYITFNKSSHISSVFSCKNPSDKENKNDCVTYFYIDGN